MTRSSTRDKIQPDSQFKPQPRTQSVSNKNPNNNRQMYKSREPSSSRKASQLYYAPPVARDMNVNNFEASLKSLTTNDTLPTAQSILCLCYGSIRNLICLKNFDTSRS